MAWGFASVLADLGLPASGRVLPPLTTQQLRLVQRGITIKWRSPANLPETSPTNAEMSASLGHACFTFAAYGCVGAIASITEVGARPPVHGVVPDSAEQFVIARSTADDVFTSQTVDDVVPAQSLDHIVARGAPRDYRSLRCRLCSQFSRCIERAGPSQRRRCRKPPLRAGHAALVGGPARQLFAADCQ